MAVPVLSDLVRGGASAFAGGGDGGFPARASSFWAYTDCVTTVADNNFGYGTTGTGASWSIVNSDAASLGVSRANTFVTRV